MERSGSLPLSGILLALLGAAGMLALRVDLWLVVAVLLVWLGSLWLAAARPPETASRRAGNGLSPDQLGALIEHSATPMLLTQGERVTVVNRAAREVIGGHLLGQDVRVGFRQPDAVKLLGRAVSGKAIVRGLVQRRDIWELNRQQLDGGLAILELVNRTAEADISRAHTDFVANASHELRTPLASIIGYVETLQEDGPALDSAMSGRFLDTIAREAKRLQSLVSDLMSLSRVEAEKHDLPEHRLDLAPLVARAAHDAAGTERAARLELALAGEAPVRGDAQQLEQLVRNLVDNALKYGDADKPVTVSLDREVEGKVRLRVTDRGDGIAAEHVPHLTRRFYRTDPGRSRASGGTGLGLAIVKHIVERHRGALDITSEVGRGTTVEVRLPLAIEPM